jgi:two-component system response regulator HydG
MRLSDYSWPGNVRELENVVERASVLARGPELTLEDLPLPLRVAEPSEQTSLTFAIGTPLTQVEQHMIRETLRRTGGDKALAAQLLGISQRTIYRKLEEMKEE